MGNGQDTVSRVFIPLYAEVSLKGKKGTYIKLCDNIFSYVFAVWKY